MTNPTSTGSDSTYSTPFATTHRITQISRGRLVDRTIRASWIRLLVVSLTEAVNHCQASRPESR